MSKFAFIAALALDCLPLNSQVTGNVLNRVFQIRVGGSTATAFVLDYEERQFVITANHVVAGAGEQARIDVFGLGDSQWHTFDFKILHGPNACGDVAVLIPTEKNFDRKSDPIPYPAVLALGQEAYFLGFPYGLDTSFSNKGARALVKHAYFSAALGCDAIYPDGKGDEGLFLLDGLNNPGFSGGPVVARDTSAPNGPFRLVGVISGYRNENVPLRVDGQVVKNAFVVINSGIILVVPIQRVTEIIKVWKTSGQR
jgi:S1-C subfamily serine protease